MPSKLRNLVQTAKPDIKIHFDHPKSTYTTLDRLEGTVTITAPHDTRFDSVDIEFIGTSRTFVERFTTAAAASGRSEAYHQFLKLSQPGNEQYYPADFVLQAGVAYEFPFIFAVPQQLLPRVCQHPVRNDAVRDLHLHLPPTFGDKDLGASQKGLDDMAPDMASVRYGIFAKISEVKIRGDEVWRSTMASRARRVRVIPAVEVQPPLDVHAEEGEYNMRKEKSIRKSMLKGKVGTLVMEAAQPPALQVQSYDNPEARTNTHATIMLRFDPFDDKTKPPKLGSLSSRLKVSTYFASCARSTVPTKQASTLDITQGLHSEQFNLSSRCMANVEWKKHHPTPTTPDEVLERRDSANSIASLSWQSPGSIPAPSETYKDGAAYYTARLVVPVQLPPHKAFPPTFHTCLISRVYALKFDLSLSSAGLASSLPLRVPIQISSEGLPRRIRVPSEELVGRSRIGSQAPLADDEHEHAAAAAAAAERPDADAVQRRRSMPESDAPPGYSVSTSTAGRARMTDYRLNFRAMSVSVH
ncbi:hypothetical protein BDY17DRAFT_316990 [Neohortaea acidophila]|uniref:Arrestin-like N-terminal domain-containing protein n=1 Tax=Neohortaea acidophila TaxID=245834 RepID=A0A6A6PVI5_9PEZI|nr:uncharacterized protein BDY17DRAFT_316990 [Neohortaea acidophila]KAF2483744.1 hypothetical protein BDY17DRAFT_316990 [Neohortaea acidophila]